jgi:hypothetical protein
MPFRTWDDTRHELAHALEGLWDEEFLILGEPVPPPEPRRGLFGRRRPAPTRYVQVLRIEDVFSAECVGATSHGGTWEMGPETVRQLRHLGWLTPAESKVAYGNDTPNFEQYVEKTGLHGLADVLVTSLHLLGARPETLELETSGGAATRARG